MNYSSKTEFISLLNLHSDAPRNACRRALKKLQNTTRWMIDTILNAQLLYVYTHDLKFSKEMLRSRHDSRASVRAPIYLRSGDRVKFIALHSNRTVRKFVPYKKERNVCNSSDTMLAMIVYNNDYLLRTYHEYYKVSFNKLLFTVRADTSPKFSRYRRRNPFPSLSEESLSARMNNRSRVRRSTERSIFA